MDCPRCRKELTFVAEGLFADIETHACRACSGTFYPRGSLDRLDDSVAVNIEEIELEPRPEPMLRCPVGHAARGGTYRAAAEPTLQPAEAIDDRRIRVAVCVECNGFWLEGNTLEQLRALALEISNRENRELNAEAIARKRAE